MNAIGCSSKLVLFLSLLLISVASIAYLHPAELRIKNDSQRQLTVKVMTAAGQRYAVASVESDSTETIDIHKTGEYYLKTKATLKGRQPVFRKGNPFKVYVGVDGYSVLTVTFSIQESDLHDPMSGRQISESEFETDSD
jgi:hypothetical protein